MFGVHEAEMKAPGNRAYWGSFGQWLEDYQQANIHTHTLTAIGAKSNKNKSRTQYWLFRLKDTRWCADPSARISHYQINLLLAIGNFDCDFGEKGIFSIILVIIKKIDS